MYKGARVEQLASCPDVFPLLCFLERLGVSADPIPDLLPNPVGAAASAGTVEEEEGQAEDETDEDAYRPAERQPASLPAR